MTQRSVANELAAIVASEYDANPGAAFSSSRVARDVTARHVAFYAASYMLAWSHQEIADTFGKSREAVSNGIRTVKRNIRLSEAFARSVGRVTGRVNVRMAG
jgi:chromosomal replication initiation ATPase DnaA